MSATVTYKGATLTTATNQTRTLDTAGTYLEDDITITDVTTIPTGTKNISITANGTTTEDVTSYASASITANVPNSYTASEEGKVVSNGSLVSQSSATYTANGAYDTTLVDDVTVDVQGGGGGITGLTYYGDIDVDRSNVSTLTPHFPVIAGRSMVVFYYDITSNANALLFASYSEDGAKYDYGSLGQNGRALKAYGNYSVTEGATEMTPSFTGAIPNQWISGTLTAKGQVYLIDQAS